eukprot:1110716-Pyramimonas_sp.AAC.1
MSLAWVSIAVWVPVPHLRLRVLWRQRTTGTLSGPIAMLMRYQFEFDDGDNNAGEQQPLHRVPPLRALLALHRR